MHASSSTFDVADVVADEFARRSSRRDRRDPHLFIERDAQGQGFAPRAQKTRAQKTRAQKAR